MRKVDIRRLRLFLFALGHCGMLTGITWHMLSDEITTNTPIGALFGSISMGVYLGLLSMWGGGLLYDWICPQITGSKGRNDG